MKCHVSACINIEHIFINNSSLSDDINGRPGVMLSLLRLNTVPFKWLCPLCGILGQPIPLYHGKRWHGQHSHKGGPPDGQCGALGRMRTNVTASVAFC